MTAKIHYYVTDDFGYKHALAEVETKNGNVVFYDVCKNGKRFDIDDDFSCACRYSKKDKKFYLKRKELIN